MVKISHLIEKFERNSSQSSRARTARASPSPSKHAVRKDSFYRRTSTFSPLKDRTYRQNGSSLLFAHHELFSAGSDADTDSSDNDDVLDGADVASHGSSTAVKARHFESDELGAPLASQTREENSKKPLRAFQIFAASVKSSPAHEQADDDDDDDNDDDNDDNDDDDDDDDDDDNDNETDGASDQASDNPSEAVDRSADSLRELVATERTYAARLAVLVDVVLATARERRLMTDLQFATVFNNVEDVRDCTSRFLAALDAASSAPSGATRNPKAMVPRSLTTTQAMIAAVQPPSIDALCGAFASANVQTPLTLYVQGYADAVALLEALTLVSAELKQLVERTDAISLLVEPVQRVSRYALLLRAVAAEHGASERLAALLTSAEAMAHCVDDALRAAEARRRTQQIEASFGPAGTTLPSRADRVLLKEGTVRVDAHSSNTLYLFDDALLVAVRGAANKPPTLKRIFMLDSTVARNNAHKDKNTLSVVDRHGSLQLRCVSSVQRREWAVAIEAAADATGADRSELVASLQFDDESGGWKCVGTVRNADADADADADDAHLSANGALRRGDLRADFVLDKDNRAMPAVIGLHNFASQPTGAAAAAAAARTPLWGAACCAALRAAESSTLAASPQPPAHFAQDQPPTHPRERRTRRASCRPSSGTAAPPPRVSRCRRS
jgi:hypothetical protein